MVWTSAKGDHDHSFIDVCTSRHAVLYNNKLMINLSAGAIIDEYCTLDPHHAQVFNNTIMKLICCSEFLIAVLVAANLALHEGENPLNCNSCTLGRLNNFYI